MYGLIGKPLGWSFSARWFGERGVEYHNFELDSIDRLPTLLAANPSLRGFNVTSPYKEAVLPFLDALSPTAAAVGAVNCVLVERTGGSRSAAGNLATAPAVAVKSGVGGSEGASGGRILIGHNTDAPALVDVLAEYCNVNPLQRSVILSEAKDLVSVRFEILRFAQDDAITENKEPCALILGTGGAARAAMWALRQLGVGYTIVSRNKIAMTYSELTAEVISKHRLIINATPVGMNSNPGLPAIPYDALTSEHLLFDMIYNPAETEFLRAGRLRGARTLNGLPMLIRQAELSAQVWGMCEARLQNLV